MLKILAPLFFVVLHTQAWANIQPCEIQDSQAESSISCDDVQISHSQKEAKVEFVDGFTLFFHFGQNIGEDRINVKPGNRESSAITSEDQKIITRLANMMGDELTEIETNVVSFFKKIPANKPLLSSASKAGGEVPWPNPENGENPPKKNDKQK